mgnify:CR=1 FL=1
MAKYNIDYEDALSFSSKDLQGMKFQDLQRTTAALTREVRSRINELVRLEKDSGLRSPSLDALLSSQVYGSAYVKTGESNGVAEYTAMYQEFSARYKNKDQLLEMIEMSKQFLNNATSTAEGTKDFYKQAAERLNVSDLTTEELKAFGRCFRRLEEYFKNSLFKIPSKQLEKEMKNAIDEQLKGQDIFDPRGGEIDWESITNAIIQKYERVGSIFTPR